MSNVCNDVCEQWLAQFNKQQGDNLLAKQLLSLINFISREKFESYIKTELGKLVDSNDDVLCIYNVRDIKNIQDIKNATPAGGDIGSEGITAKIIRDFCRASDRVYSHLDLNHLREKKVRSIILLNDSALSGSQVNNYFKILWGSKTIKSWYSRKYIKFKVLVYTATSGVLDLPLNSKIIYKEEAERLDDLMKKHYKVDKSKVDSFLQSYTDKKMKKFHLGYNDSMSNIVFEHGCPNNVPPIFHFQSENWKAIFPKRLINEEARMAFDNKIFLKNDLEHMRYKCLRSIHSKRASDVYDLEMMRVEVMELVEELSIKGFINDKYMLTNLGIKELYRLDKYYKKFSYDVPKSPILYYYPSQLRMPSPNQWKHKLQ